MTGLRPRCTVIVTSYNQAHLVEQALDSVAEQTEKDVQLLVTDDGSTDASVEKIESWLARRGQGGTLVASRRNVGLPAMLNRALPMIAGEYVVVLNGDDWMERDRLAVQAAALDASPPRVGLVYSDLRVVDAAGRPTGEVFPPPSVERSEGDVLLRIIESPMVGMPSVMFRRSVLDRVGPWDESLVADDFDFLLRVAAAGYEFRYVPAVIANYREGEGTLTAARSADLAEGRIHALKKHLGRRSETDSAINERIEGLAVALHGLNHSRAATRRHLLFALRRRRSRRVARALAENLLGLRAGSLAAVRAARRRNVASKGSEDHPGPDLWA